MNWIKLDKNIKGFADNHNLQIEEVKASFLGGQTTTFRFTEDSVLYYEIKHSKPVGEYGSKLRVYSAVDMDIFIRSKTYWFKKPSITISGRLSDKASDLVKELASLIGPFKLITGLDNLGWPKDLIGKKQLIFESDRIDLATAELERIRETKFGTIGRSVNAVLNNKYLLFFTSPKCHLKGALRLGWTAFI